jgi:hypothetical protein
MNDADIQDEDIDTVEAPESVVDALRSARAAPYAPPPCAFCGGELIHEDGVERCDTCGVSAPLDGVEE